MINPFRKIFSRSRIHRRDFASPRDRTENPLFKGSYHQSRWWMGFLAILFLILLIGGSIYLLISPRFRITSVTVEGTVRLDPQSIERFVSNRLNQGLVGLQWRRVVYLAPTNALAKELRASIEKLVSLNNLTIERQGRNKLVVRIEERTPNLIWQSSFGNRYIVDEKGIVVEKLEGPPQEGLLALADANNLAPSIGSQVVTPSYIRALKTIAERLPSLALQSASFTTWKVTCPRSVPKETTAEEEITVNGVINAPTRNGNTTILKNQNRVNANEKQPASTNRSSRPASEDCDLGLLAVNEPTLVVKTSEGWEIRFDSSTDIELQLQKLGIALRERLDEMRDTLHYVDVRFGDRVFYQ